MTAITQGMTLGCLLLSTAAMAGVTVQPIQSTLPEEAFQTLLVSKLLGELGYDVKPAKEADYNVGYASVASGDATFLAFNWDPLHKDKYEKAGGDTKFYRKGTYVTGAAQGYLIDKATADKYGITNIAQLKDPKLAALFDSDGDGKADLAGCNPGWGCEMVINHQLKTYGLAQTVTHQQGNYAAIIADTITRFKEQKPVLYYTWTPYWVSGELVPGKDVVWLEVPYTALPEGREGDTQLANGKNYGFEMNTMHIVANKGFAEANPSAAKLFAEMKLPINDINVQNGLMKQGQNKPADIERHADAWLKGHEALVNDWLTRARAAK
ncbi:glycine betaine ABC transporter substrate-binding protein [Aeromonas enteropelogenes]|uniref:Glycine betaine/L-proline ABC transporter substrate-binding protein ProX n=1 Tax=Aeromonas sp. 19NY04SH05-1 TaxID=2920537 RepID=A0AAU6TAV4_9GAMM|nr:glycine betaine/L-proline ABC transporter substrate-binding protein ProX [Aeromonas enteropelogenes]MBL0520474.1 glycine betaine/L-proline ABC transporter substrate-binding protein ProX [Aeromonas enteropelogenes]BEE16617.1 glycine betaine ABC transporter substrate-binding protein [Aeromonas enteropelogenes]BEE20780.1 glycine betaine ABC transporter substrate-binding protein [Aeromonas enteropelogenes]